MLDFFRKHLSRPVVAPCVPPGVAVYAIGDIHGRADLLSNLHQTIAADEQPNIERRVVIYLGDYIDRGTDSRSVIDSLVENPLHGFEAIHLQGNHEQMLLDFFDNPADGGIWLANGGRATLLSYGILSPPEFESERPQDRERDALVAAMPDTHRSFLSRLRLNWSIGDYFFVHAGVRPGIPLTAQNDMDMLWIRDKFCASRKNHGKIVVHGHSTSTEPEVRHNRIGIDTGAYATSRLTALALVGTEQRFLSTG